MNNPFGTFQPEAAFSGAAERFLELLKSFGMPAAAAAGRPPDWSGLAGPLASQFEQWLKMSQASGPWFGAGAGAAPGGFAAAAPAWAFGPLPLGPAALQGNEPQHVLELLGRLGQLQGQLAAHWSEVARRAAGSFIARAGGGAAAPATPDEALRLYELWVECAEEAYGATVRRDDFCRLQAELANTSAALLVEQRRHAETLVRAFGLPTRSEVDALYGQLKELRAQLAQLRAAPAGRGPRAPRPRPVKGRSRPARKGRAARARGPRT